MMKVKVTQPVQLVYAGEHHTIGDVVEVPDRVGADWIRQGWAVQTKPAAPRKRSG